MAFRAYRTKLAYGIYPSRDESAIANVGDQVEVVDEVVVNVNAGDWQHALLRGLLIRLANGQLCAVDESWLSPISSDGA